MGHSIYCSALDILTCVNKYPAMWFLVHSIGSYGCNLFNHVLTNRHLGLYMHFFFLLLSLMISLIPRSENTSSLLKDFDLCCQVYNDAISSNLYYHQQHTFCECSFSPNPYQYCVLSFEIIFAKLIGKNNNILMHF